MPGLFGGLGCLSEHYEFLKDSFQSIWGECEVVSFPDSCIGGHAFKDDSALHDTAEGLHFVVDGEDSIYKNASQFAQNGEPTIFNFKEHKLELGVNCKGNVAILDQGDKTLYLATEWTGSFPLYFTNVTSGLLFSSHLRPLSQLVKATPDPIGIIQFLKYGFILAGRTFFKEIHRLMPGQVLTFQQNDKRVNISETSKAWMNWNNQIEFDELLYYNWNTLVNAMIRCFEFSDKHALMASAGWDTRILLAVMQELNETDNLLCYTHGDLKSREISIIKRIVEDLGIKHHLEILAADMFDIKDLQRGFDRVENVIFPHYHRAGARLVEAGIDCIAAGVLGEVIGGRHGMHWPMLPISEWDKISFVLSHFIHLRKYRNSSNINDLRRFYNFLRLGMLRKPWYIRTDYWNEIPNIKDEINADLEEFVQRLKTRGVKNVDKIIEAFTAEYFGSQYLTPQLLSCRSEVNIAIPFADQELLKLTSSIPLTFKIVHYLQQAVLRCYNSELLKYPNAAAFFNSKIPIPMLEISRVFRKIFESVSWKMCRASNGHYKPTPIGWATFDCLGNSKVLLDVIENFQCDVIDKDKIKNRIKSGLSQTKPHKSMYTWNAAQNQIMKIYTTDLMLR